MPKSSTSKLKEDKKRVLNELISDARKSSHQIAKKCNFSRQKAWRLIETLEKDHSIWGYTAVIDENKFGRNTYFALHRINSPFSDMIDQIIERIKTKVSANMNINLYGSYYLNGIYDWITIFSAKDIIDAKKYCSYIQKEFGTYLEKIDILESVFTLKKSGIVNPDIDSFRDFKVK